MSQMGQATGDIQERLGFEQLCLDVSAKLISAPDERFTTAIEDALGSVVRFFGADRGGILAVSRGGWSVHLAHAWYSTELTERVPGDLNLVDLFPYGARLLVEQKQPFIVERWDDAPLEAARDRATHAVMGVRSTLNLPILVGGVVRYIVNIEAMTREVHWPASYLPRLQLLGEIIASTIERRRVNQALRESEARLALATRSAGAGAWDLDITSGRIWATPEAKVLYGFPHDADVSLEMVLQAVHPDDVGRVRARLAEVASTGVEFADEYRVVLPGGGVRWIAARGSIPGDDDRAPGHMLGVSLDVTAKKRDAEALEQANADLRRLRDQLERENIYLRQEATALQGRGTIVGQSPAMRRALLEIEKVAATDSTVLLLGETGTGKELLAAAIHNLSSRRNRAMVRVNCAAIPATLIEAELFGREKGAYTGALSKQVGRFEVASGSTIFLDEIGDLPMDIQIKLLRVLQERQIERLGSPRPVDVDLRVIAATNRDLAKDVREGRFREDLYYRLNVFPVRVPPLRERMDDLPLLIEALMQELGGKMGKHFESVARSSMEAVRRYHWPGNVRELRNVVERAMILAPGPVLEVEIPEAGVPAAAGPRATRAAGMSRDELLRVLEQCGWRIRGVGGAAERLGLKATTVEYRMARLGIKRP